MGKSTQHSSQMTAVLGLTVFCLLFASSVTQAAVQMVAPELDPMITFDEVDPMTVDPVYTIGGTVIRFGSLFDGQVLGSDPNTLLDSTPDSPLMLSASDPNVATVLDLSNPTYWVLGSITNTTGFTAPLAIYFDDPVNRVEFDLGDLDTAGTTTIQAYDADGNVLATFENTEGGLQRIALADDSGANIIAGVSIFVQPGEMDWEGFAIDNVSFSFEENVVPEPTTIAIWGLLALIAPLCCTRKPSE